jgi:hypothetical protein
MQIRNKHIVVCGDSFCSYEIDGKERHFSQILQQEYGYRVTNLAKQGCSQVMIAYQIKAALEEFSADVVVHNKTFADRFDVKLDSRKNSFTYSINSFVYDNIREASSTYFGSNGTIKSTNLGSINWLDNNKQIAAATFLTEVEEYYIREQVVNWIHDYWHIQIESAGKMSIPLLKDTNPGQILYDFCDHGKNKYASAFHTDEKTQILVAKQIDKIIKDC